jgi:hypothetical protein
MVAPGAQLLMSIFTDKDFLSSLGTSEANMVLSCTNDPTARSKLSRLPICSSAGWLSCTSSKSRCTGDSRAFNLLHIKLNERHSRRFRPIRASCIGLATISGLLDEYS